MLVAKEDYPMSSITIGLRRSYAVAAIALWPVITNKYGAVTRSYVEKNADVRSYVENIVVMSRCFLKRLINVFEKIIHGASKDLGVE